MLTTEQKILAAICHGGIFFGAPIIIPLIVMLISKDDYVKTQAKEALMFQILIILSLIASGILIIIFIGIIGIIGFSIAGIVFPIIAIVNVLNGKDYSYPVSSKWARNI